MKHQGKSIAALVLAAAMLAGTGVGPAFAAGHSVSPADERISSYRFGDPTQTKPSEIPLIQIELNRTEVTVKPGNYTALVVMFTPFNTTADKKVKWYSTNETVATVTSNGLVKGIRQGTANIIAQVGNFTASCRVVVGYPSTIIVEDDDDGSKIMTFRDDEKYRELTVTELDGMRYISIKSETDFPQAALPELRNFRLTRSGEGLLCAEWEVYGNADGFEVYASTDGETYHYACDIEEMKYFIPTAKGEDVPNRYLIIGYARQNDGTKIYGTWSPVLAVS